MPSFLLSQTDLRLLSLVKQSPQYGYELLKSGPGLKASSVYHSLHKLEEYGLTLSKLITEPKKPAKRLYQITRQGEYFLEKEIHQYVSKVQKSTEQLLEEYVASRAILHWFEQFRLAHVGGSPRRKMS